MLTVLAGIILSLWLGRALTARDHKFAKAEFRISAARWNASLQRFVADRVARVSTTAAFIYGSDINDRKDFHTFVRQFTKSMPSIEVLAWAPRIPAAQRNTHEEAVRKEESRSKYVISDRDDRGRLVAAGKRDEYYPILFAEPSPNNDALLGLDLGSDVAGRAALREARTTRRAMLAIYKAVPGDKSGGDLLFVLEPARYESVASHIATRPADQPEADGFVLTVFRVEAMVDKWLKLPDVNIPLGIDVYLSANGKVLASLHSGSPPRPIQAAGELPASPPAKVPVGCTLTSDEFEIANMNFKVQYMATAPYLTEAAASRKPLIATLTGLLITSLAAGYFWLLTGRMAGVQRQVADRWLELRERERYIRHLIESTSDAVFLHDEQGQILDVNRRACDALGYSREELLSLTVADVELPAVAENPRPPVRRGAEEHRHTFERVYRRKDSTTFPVEVHATLVGSGDNPLILAVVCDITGRKQAEKAS